ncbi:MAG: hypothetical protein HOP28_12020 [Gemmatimonadales bacterium]|nr:hypothetical protein [Gemmatimonadales bacterium]
MKTVFIGGSRKVFRLNEQIRLKLAEITERGFHVLVGDANGADRAVQAQLRDWGYTKVTVFFVGGAPRNNEGAWPTERIAPPSSARGADYYGAKDVVMARNAEAGLMIWDGKSKGTLANVRNLVREHKPVAVYVSQQKRFKNILDEAELQALSSGKQFGTAQSQAGTQAELFVGATVRTAARKRRRRAV